MVTLRSITIPEWIDKKLRESKNASALITSLLEKHYSLEKIKNKDEKIEEYESRIKNFVEEKEKEKMEFIENCKREKELMVKELGEIERIEQNSKEIQEKIETERADIKEKRIKEYRLKIFFNIVSREMSAAEYEDFLSKYPKISIQKFAEEKKEATQ